MSTELFPIDITVAEQNNISRQQQLIQTSIPFPLGCVFSSEELQLFNSEQQAINFQTAVLCHWHDKSIRWMSINFFSDCPARSKMHYYLEKVQQQTSVNWQSPLQIIEHDQHLEVSTGTCRFFIDTQQFKPFLKVIFADEKIEMANSDIYLDMFDSKLNPIITNYVIADSLEPNLKQCISFVGEFKNPNHPKGSTLFAAELTFFANSSICDMSFTIHNPKAAKHEGGFWDLGDPSSLYFKSLKLSFPIEQTAQFRWKNLEQRSWFEIPHQEFNLRQDSSGGERWNHRIHVDKDNNSLVSYQGFKLSSANECIQQGLRASPLIAANAQNGDLLQVYLHQFWQNFPKAMSFNDNQLYIEIFPAMGKFNYELQGGEQKTHTISFNFFSPASLLEQHIYPLQVSLNSEHYLKAQAIAGQQQAHQPRELDNLINYGINGDNNFFYKREKGDEYGWRNFGDIWADHETLEHGNNDTLVTHYNNQYDVIYGFAKQYMLSHDPRWLELLDDLAKHVIDIDIYHTDQDRPEYNQGLFWHTDHYLDGVACSHRTFSKNHMEIDHVEQSGGGPGSEHCYSTGLMYHYFLTSNQKSKDTVLAMAKWAQYANEGTFSIMEYLLRVLQKDIPNFQKLLKRQYIFKYSLPLSRGTGNYINTLLDAYILTQEDAKIKHIANVIQMTIGPNDPIEQRGLMEDIELNWHYTVFLQSVFRYLSVKESIEQFDDDYHYALQTFTHYAQWVLEHEKPYLDNKEKLVYPNDTWVAQDMRKASILSAYLKYCSAELNHEVLHKRDFFLNYIEQHFAKADNHTTRIQALLMQNYDFSHKTLNNNIFTTTKTYHNPRLSLIILIQNIIKGFLARLIKIKLKNELDWIKSRITN